MKFLILIYHNPEGRAAWESFTPEEQASAMNAYAALNEQLSASGELIVTQALADPSLTRQVALRDGEVVTADGPFAEVKEQLAGFYLVECESIERAVEIGASIPDASVATIEVRPVMTYEGFDG